MAVGLNAKNFSLGEEYLPSQASSISSAGKAGGKLSALGSMLGPIGTGVGAVGAAIAGYFGDKDAAAEEQRRWEKEQGLNTAAVMYDEERKRREEQRNAQLAAELAKLSQRRAA